MLKDSGHGITDESIKFWNKNKERLGKVTHVIVTQMPLYTELRESGSGTPYTVEYNFIAVGNGGMMLLSGCNCGYGGTGPNGTVRILVELGAPVESARRAMGCDTILFDALVCEIYTERQARK